MEHCNADVILMNSFSPLGWRLKLVRPDCTLDAERRFHDLKSLLGAAMILRRERPDLRLIITVPEEASEEDRGLVEKIANRVPPRSE
jgi:hypothetical protein